MMNQVLALEPLGLAQEKYAEYFVPAHRIYDA